MLFKRPHRDQINNKILSRKVPPDLKTNWRNEDNFWKNNGQFNIQNNEIFWWTTTETKQMKCLDRNILKKNDNEQKDVFGSTDIFCGCVIIWSCKSRDFPDRFAAHMTNF